MSQECQRWPNLIRLFNSTQVLSNISSSLKGRCLISGPGFKNEYEDTSAIHNKVGHKTLQISQTRPRFTINKASSSSQMRTIFFTSQTKQLEQTADAIHWNFTSQMGDLSLMGALQRLHSAFSGLSVDIQERTESQKQSIRWTNENHSTGMKNIQHVRINLINRTH
jgi:hypothetical protein